MSNLRGHPMSAFHLVSKLVLTGLFVAPSTAVQPAPASAPAAVSESGLELHDCIILVDDRFRPGANGADLFKSTLPSFIATKRPREGAGGGAPPRPVGVIRAYGEFTDAFDVLLEAPDGGFLASWPRAGGRVDRILWEALQPSTDPAGTLPLLSGHWFEAVRRGEARYLSLGSRKERALIYDVHLKYVSPLEVAAAEDGVAEARHTGGATLWLMEAYRPEGSQWRVASVGDVAEHKPLEKQDEPDPVPQGAASQPASLPSNEASPTTQETAGAPSAPRASAPTSEPAAKPRGVPIRFSDHPAADRTDAVRPWGDWLRATGLSDEEAELAVDTLAAMLHEKRMTLVYRLDPAELDRILPIDVVPRPRRLIRVALVVVLNADPAAEREIEELIAQLGDPSWARRVAAERALKEFGKAAEPRLRQALNNSDLEIVHRAERLLAEFEAGS